MRIERGLSQRQLAEKADVSAVTVYLIETEQSTPRPSTMSKLAKALAVSPGYLYWGNDDGRPDGRDDGPH